MVWCCIGEGGIKFSAVLVQMVLYFVVVLTALVVYCLEVVYVKIMLYIVLATDVVRMTGCSWC